LSTKIHLLTNGLGEPLAFRLTPGQAAEQPQALPLLEGRQADAVIADKGYDTRAIVAQVRAMGAAVVIPSRSHWLVQREHDRALYRQRNRIERCFNRLKNFRRLATRYCRLRCCFQSTVALACAWILLGQYVDTP
jgi:transposase